MKPQWEHLQATCKLYTLVNMLDPVVRFQYDRILIRLRVYTERTVHMRPRHSTLVIFTQRWFILMFGPLHTHTGMTLK